LAAEEGGRVKLDKVLMIADGDNITLGKPYVDGARVTATVKKNGRGDKIIVFKYKAKVRYRRKKGHHQLNTSLNIDKILPPGVEEPKPVKRIQPKKTVEAVKPVEKTPPKPAVEAVKPVKKTPRKPTAEAVKPVKRTPHKKTEEKADGA
jgi:large subunit ribosomal protein L21